MPQIAAGDSRLRGVEVGGPRNQYRPIHPAGTADALDRRLRAPDEHARTSNRPGIATGWPSPARDAGPVAREHRVTCGSRLKRSSGSPSFGARSVQRVFRQVRAEGGAPLQPDRKTRRRLHFLGQERRLHRLSGPAGSMPDLAVLARECRVARRMGPRSIGLPGLGPRPVVYRG